MHKYSLLSEVKRIFTTSTSRAVMLFFLLLLFPLYAMSFLFYERSYNTIQEDILSSHQVQIKNYMQVLENDIQYIRSQQLNLVNDSELNTLSFSYDDMSLYDIILAERSMLEKMDTLCSSSIYVEDASVWLLSSGISISGKNGISSLTEQDYAFIQNSAQNPASPIAVYKKTPYMVLFSPYLMDLTAESLKPVDAFALIIQLNLKPFTSTIGQGDSLYNMEAVLKFGNDIPEHEAEASSDVSSYLAEEIERLRDEKTAGSLHLSYQDVSYIVSYQYSQTLGALLLSYTPEASVVSPLNFFRNWLIVFLVLSILVVGAFSFMIYIKMHKPLQTLLGAFHRVERGEMDISIEHKGSDEFAYIYDGFNSMITTMRQLNNEVYEQTILMQQAELKQLQQKINPHFLYNAFFSISTVSMAEGCDISSRLAQRLGEYFRFVTKEASEKVSLSNELKYARIYAEIQEMRFSNRISIHIDELPRPELSSAQLPALLLQPLIENALEHGLQNKLSDGVIHVGFQETGDFLTLFVEDNGDELKDEDLETIRENCIHPKEAKTAGALSNIYRRLSISFGRENSMHISRSELGGLRVEIEIPVQFPAEQ